jgi:hypothetical protein
LPQILQEIGAVAGIASVVGLAVLSALYFSQARDVKRLREWAGRAPERAEQGAPVVPGRVPAQPQPPVPARPAAPPVPGQPAATPGTGARPAAATPAAAATGARPATASQGPPATPAPGSQGAPATTPAPGQDAAAAEKDRSPEPVAAAVAPAAENANAANAKGATAEERDAPKAAVASPPQPPRVGGPATPAAQRPGGAPAVPSPAARSPSRPGGPPRAPSQPTEIIPPPRPEPWYRSLIATPRYLVLVVAGILVLGGGAAFGISKLTSDDSGGGAGSQQGSQTGSGKQGDPGGGGTQRNAGAVKPGTVTVAILNGTTVPGLAATLSDQVGAAGFKVGTIANFTDQQLAESVVQYAPGHQHEAAAVARKVGIGQREAVSPSSRDLAGDATVIVIVGADKSP